jgi:hypothetical protein
MNKWEAIGLTIVASLIVIGIAAYSVALVIYGK